MAINNDWEVPPKEPKPRPEREEAKARTFTVTNLDAKLHDAFRRTCQFRKKTARSVLMGFMLAYSGNMPGDDQLSVARVHNIKRNGIKFRSRWRELKAEHPGASEYSGIGIALIDMAGDEPVGIPAQAPEKEKAPAAEVDPTEENMSGWEKGRHRAKKRLEAIAIAEGRAIISVTGEVVAKP